MVFHFLVLHWNRVQWRIQDFSNGGRGGVGRQIQTGLGQPIILSIFERKRHEIDKIGLGVRIPSVPLDPPIVPIVLVAPYFFRLKTGHTSWTSAYVFWFPIVRTDILPFYSLYLLMPRQYLTRKLSSRMCITRFGGHLVSHSMWVFLTMFTVN